MLKINIDNLSMLIRTMVNFIVGKPTLDQLVMVKLFIIFWLLMAKLTIIKLNMPKKMME